MFSRLLVGRTRRRRVAPRRESSCATWLPTKPVAPVTKIFRPVLLLELQIPPLRYAPVGMTKGRVAFFLSLVARDVKIQHGQS
jgi:hypothetical protein